MTEASGCGAQLRMSAVPLISCALKYARAYTFPGGASDNRLFVEHLVSFADEIPEEERMLLFDPQTSGGLLIAVPSEKLEIFQQSAKQSGTPVWEIGSAEAGTGIRVLG